MADSVAGLRQLLFRTLIVGLAMVGCAAPAPSGPPASPRISCVAIPAEKCDEAVASVARSLPNTAPVSIDVLCVSGTCTSNSGAIDTVVTLADGGQLRSSTMSWSAPMEQGTGGATPLPVDVPPPVGPPPNIPVQPVCQGVPVSMCATVAETAFGELRMDAVVQIVVRCNKPPCTNDGGTGDTVVTYADGTIATATWEYAN